MSPAPAATATQYKISVDKLPVRVEAGQPIRLALGLTNESAVEKPTWLRLVGLGQPLEAKVKVGSIDAWGDDESSDKWRTFGFEYSGSLPAGTNPVVVEWRDDDGTLLASTDLTLEVAEISQVRVTLDQPRRSGLLGRTYKLYLDDDRKTPAVGSEEEAQVLLLLNAHVPAKSVVVDFACEQLNLIPGSQVQVRTKVGGRRLRLFGATQEHVFDVSATGPSGSTTTTGVFRQRALFPPILFKVVLVALLVILFAWGVSKIVRWIVAGDPSAAWTALPMVDDPAVQARSGHTATWVRIPRREDGLDLTDAAAEVTSWIAGESSFQDAVVVWGGEDRAGRLLNSGLMYSPTDDEWTEVGGTTNLPSERTGHTAAWTGDRLVVWGGFTPADVQATAGVPDEQSPSPETTPPDTTISPESSVPPDTTSPPGTTGAETTDSSTTESTSNELVPTRLASPTGTATLLAQAPADLRVTTPYGAQFDPATNRWVALPDSGLSHRVGHSMIWTGSALIVYGGMSPGGDILDDGGILRVPPARANTGLQFPGDLSNGVWELFRTSSAQPQGDGGSQRTLRTFPAAARAFHAAAFDGRYMVISGGAGPSPGPDGLPETAVLSDNYAYDIALDTWHLLPNAYFEPRVCHQAVADTGGVTTFLGGLRSDDLVDGELRLPTICSRNRIVDRRDPASWSLQLAPDQDTQGAIAFEWTLLATAPEHLGANFVASWMGNAIGIAFSVQSLDSVAPIRFDPGENPQVEMLPAADQLTFRSDLTAAWNGNRLFVWGGRGEENCPDPTAGSKLPSAAPVADGPGALGPGCPRADGARIDVDDSE